MPLVSVLMPVYNGTKYLVTAVESILGQTLRDFELLVVDDGSTDGSLAILNEYALTDKRVKVLARAHSGLIPSLNAGLAAASGEYLARMDADDISLPNRLEAQVAFLEAHKDCAAVGCSLLEIDPDGEPLSVVKSPSTHEEIEGELLIGRGRALPHPGAMFPRRALDAVGPYRGFPDEAEDLDLYLRLGEIGRLANLDAVLLHYRLHSQSFVMTRKRKMHEAVTRAIASAYERRNWSGFKRESIQEGWLSPADLRAHWAYKALYSRNYRTARKHIREALRLKPVSARFWRVWVETVVRDWVAPRRIQQADTAAGAASLK